MEKEYTYYAGLYPDYITYLLSDRWKEVKEKHMKPFCELCGIERQKGTFKFLCEKEGILINVFYLKENLTCHHLNYDNVGNEKAHDLMTVCHDCHNKIEKYIKIKEVKDKQKELHDR